MDRISAAKRALNLLDLTSLESKDDEASTERLCLRANNPEGRVAAVCVWPRLVKQAKSFLKTPAIKVAAVAVFPDGALDRGRMEAETKTILHYGGDEVDLVFPWQDFRNGKRDEATAQVAGCKAICGSKKLKVILETGELKEPHLIEAAGLAAIAGGADFLKTSTGKTPVSATPEAAEILLMLIQKSGKPVGFKASGGIRTLDQAIVYLDMADRIMGPGWANPTTFRFGASSLLDSLLGELRGTSITNKKDGY